MGAAEQDFQGVNQMPASTRCKMPCLEVCVFVWRWECYHRTNMGKVGRKGAPRWKGGGGGVYPLFSPYSPPCSFSPSEQFSSRAKGQEITKCLFSPPRLSFSSNAIFAPSLLSIYTFSASSNSKWERLFPCAAPCVYLAMFPTAPRHRAVGEK